MKKLLLATCLATLATPALAEEYLTGYAGWFDLVDNEQEATQFGVEYRMKEWQYNIHPTIGANVTTDSSYYVYGGFNWDIEVLPKEIYLVPNFMAGGYAKGDGKDLGHGLEFRSGLELDYQMKSGSRVGVAFNHISNASLGDKNPGAETLLLNYSMPLGNARKW